MLYSFRTRTCTEAPEVQYVYIPVCTSDPCVRVYCSCVRVRMEVKRYLFPEIDTVRVCTIHVRKYFGKYFRTPEIDTKVLSYFRTSVRSKQGLQLYTIYE